MHVHTASEWVLQCLFPSFSRLPTRKWGFQKGWRKVGGLCYVQDQVGINFTTYRLVKNTLIDLHIKLGSGEKSKTICRIPYPPTTTCHQRKKRGERRGRAAMTNDQWESCWLLDMCMKETALTPQEYYWGDVSFDFLDIRIWDENNNKSVSGLFVGGKGNLGISFFSCCYFSLWEIPRRAPLRIIFFSSPPFRADEEEEEGGVSWRRRVSRCDIFFATENNLPQPLPRKKSVRKKKIFRLISPTQKVSHDPALNLSGYGNNFFCGNLCPSRIPSPLAPNPFWVWLLLPFPPKTQKPIHLHPPKTKVKNLHFPASGIISSQSFFFSLSPSFGGSCEIFSKRGKNVVCIGSPAVFTCRFCCCDRKGLIFSQYKGEWGGGLLVNWSWKCWWRKKTVGATFVCLSDTKCCQKREGCNFIRQPPNTFFASKKPQVTAKLLKKGKGKDGKRRHASFYKIGKWCYVPCLTKCPSSLFLGVRSHCTVVAKAEKTGGGRQKVSPPRINLTQLVTLLSLLFPWGAP